MNLHGIARGYIEAVNPSTAGVWVRSTGYTIDPTFKQVPTYSNTPVRLQVQALTGGDLKKLEQLNVQGVERAVYMFGNGQGVVRVDELGGDLLQFPQVRGGPMYTWKVVAVLETWTPDVAGWCKLGVALQVDP